MAPNLLSAKVIFFTPVCHSFCSRGGEYLTRPDTPPPRTRQVPPPRDQAGTPQDQVGTIPPQTKYIPPDQAGTSADSGIRSTISRYASYWNVFLF